MRVLSVFQNRVARRLAMAVTVAGLLSFNVACTTGPYTKQGAVVGSLLGAGAGGIIGHQSGRGLEGAAIGGALGALAGGTYGSAQDDYHQQQQQRRAAAYGYRHPHPHAQTHAQHAPPPPAPEPWETPRRSPYYW